MKGEEKKEYEHMEEQEEADKNDHGAGAVVNGRSTVVVDDDDVVDDDNDDDDNDDCSPVKAKKNVFVHSDEHVWLPARILEQTGNDQARVQVFDLSGTTREETVDLADYPPQNTLPLKNVNEYGDMVDLPFLHEV